MIVGDNIERIQIFISGLFSERKSQATTNSLHGENVALRRIKRNNSKQVVYIPAFLQLVDMEHDFNRV